MNKASMVQKVGKPACSNSFSCFAEVAKMFSKKCFAFTLAETLIVMGIIGVVAALTLPNLNSSTGNKEIVSKVKKIVSNLEDALGRTQAVYGPCKEWNFSDSDNAQEVFGSRISDFLKITKTCALARGERCFAGTYTGLDGSSIAKAAPDTPNLYKVILADGTSLGFWFGTSNLKLQIYFDIDGPNKGPAVFGKDMFFLGYDLNENNWTTSLVPQNMKSWGATDFLKDGGWGAYWILRYDNADYLKCPSDLSETVITCK